MHAPPTSELFLAFGGFRSLFRLVGRFLLLRLAISARLQGRAENVAERRAGIGRAVLGDRLFLFGNFQRLDRNGDLARTAIELRNPRVDLLADRKALGALIAT